MIAFLLTSDLIEGQNSVFVKADPVKKNCINVKWYCPSLINAEGFHVYRRENDSEWTRLTQTPLRFKEYSVTQEDLHADKELSGYLELASKHENIKGLGLFAVLFKSFKSEVLCRYLGIWYDDGRAVQDHEYEYMVTSISGNLEHDLAISAKIKTSDTLPIPPPTNIRCEAGNKKISFKWEPEPNRYFGVNIYRFTDDSLLPRKITKDPIVLSTSKNSKGEYAYPETFFVDQHLKPGTTYHYYFEALDFFGRPSLRSKQFDLSPEDLDPPSPPDSISHKLSGKKVQLHWRKKHSEPDFLGFNVYRTNRNDTDFIKINSKLIVPNELSFYDTVPHFGSYLYMLASIDKAGNESVSNSHFVEVYDNEAPAKPKCLSIEADTGRFILRWEKNTEEDLQGYLIYRTINKPDEDSYVKITPHAIKENYFVDLAPPNTKNKYLYKVIAVDNSLNRSPYSECAFSQLPDVCPPSAPFLKSVHQNERKHIIVEWFANPEPDLAGYHIFRKNCNDSAGEYEKLNVSDLDPIVIRYTDREVEEGTYDYFLLAIDSSRNSSPSSNHIKYKMGHSQTHEEVSFARFEAKYSEKQAQVALAWKLRKDAEIKGCIIYKMGPNENVFSPITTITDKTTYTDSNISQNLDYLYQVRAYGLNGDIYKSEKVIVKTNK